MVTTDVSGLAIYSEDEDDDYSFCSFHISFSLSSPLAPFFFPDVKDVGGGATLALSKPYQSRGQNAQPVPT